MKPETVSALHLYKKEILNGWILPPQASMDDLLNYIISPGTITEFTGLPGSGKTQISLLLCVSVQLPKTLGGFQGPAMYISTNRNFASHRLREYVRGFLEQYQTLELPDNRYQFDENYFMKNIHFVQIKSAVELLACVNELAKFLENQQVRLIVIDSISYAVRNIEPEIRNFMVNQMLTKLRSLADKFCFAVVITNDMTTRTNKGKPFLTPALGDSFYHLINSRILLSKHNDTFSGNILKSINNSEKEVYFNL